MSHARQLAIVAMLSAAACMGACNSTSNSGDDAGEISAGGSHGSGGTVAGTGGSQAGTGGSAVGTGGSRAGTGGSAVGTGGSTTGPDAGSPGTGGSNGVGGRTGTGGTVVVDAGADTGGGLAMSFFVSSDTSATANLGGLAGADARCQRLATAVGRGGATWHAYLSTEGAGAVNARDRIGTGPWYNANGAMLAASLTALHARTGDPAVFLTERGARINGQFMGSPGPLEHDILTGSQRDGTAAPGLNCANWTGTTGNSEVGHSDGLGPNMGTTGSLSFWNAAHTGQCGNTTPGGGAGRIYCFRIN